MVPFPISVEPGIVEPNELRLLQGVYEEYCSDASRDRADEFAQNLVVAYKVGIRNPELLRRMAMPWRGQLAG
jgi:hypothetical protein